jgi:hypothetical protein
MTANLLYYIKSLNVYTKNFFSLIKLSTKATWFVQLLVGRHFHVQGQCLTFNLYINMCYVQIITNTSVIEKGLWLVEILIVFTKKVDVILTSEPWTPKIPLRVSDQKNAFVFFEGQGSVGCQFIDRKLFWHIRSMWLLTSKAIGSFTCPDQCTCAVWGQMV